MCLAVPGMKSKVPKNAKMVFSDAIEGSADKPNPAGSKIVESTHIVVDHSLQGCRQRIDREIPSSGVPGPVPCEGDSGAPPVGLDILAQGRDLELPLVRYGDDGAVREPGRDETYAGSFQKRGDLQRWQVRGKVNIGIGPALQDCVPDTASDEPGVPAALGKQAEQLAGIPGTHPVLWRQPHIHGRRRCCVDLRVTGRRLRHVPGKSRRQYQVGP